MLDFLKGTIDFPKNSTHEGKIYINSHELTFEDVQKLITYVQQESIRGEVFTTREILTSVAELRFDSTEEEVEERVDRIIKDMHLEKCVDTYFGDALNKGLSGGEKKRVCIASKLLIDSPILLLDEPTSGLDSSTSYTIISYLRRYAKKYNKIILMTIHQPSSNIFDLFDKLMIINHGRYLYQGPGHVYLVNYFESKGASMKRNYNPSDSFMQVLEEYNRIEDKKYFFVEQYSSQREDQVIAEMEKYLNNFEESHITINKLEVYSSFNTAVRVLVKNNFRLALRNANSMLIKILTILFNTFVAGSIFWKLEDNLEGNRGRFGFILFYTINVFMFNIMNMVMNYPKERVLLKDDYNTNLYGIVPYHLAKQLIETPAMLIITIVYCILVYFLIGYKETAYNFFIFLGIYVAFTFNTQSLGYIFAVCINSMNQALQVISVGNVAVFLFSSLVLNPKNMPIWLSWVRYFNPIFYCAQSVAINELEDRNFEGFNFYLEMKENLEIWHCMVFLVGVGCLLRALSFIGLQLVVNRQI